MSYLTETQRREAAKMMRNLADDLDRGINTETAARTAYSAAFALAAYLLRATQTGATAE